MGPTRSDPVHIITLRDSRPPDTLRLRPITASSGGAAVEQTEIAADDVVTFLLQDVDQMAADVALVTSDEDLHASF